MGEFIYSLALHFSGVLSNASSLVLSRKINHNLIQALILEPLPGVARTKTIDIVSKQAAEHLELQLARIQRDYPDWQDISSERVALVVNTPIDLQQLHILTGTKVEEGAKKLQQISYNKHYQLLTKRTIDVLYGADSPLSGQLGAQVLRFKYMLPYLQKYELGDNLFESWPTASLIELHKENKALDDQVFKEKNKRDTLIWDGQYWLRGNRDKLKNNVELLGFTSTVPHLKVSDHEFAALLSSLVALNTDEKHLLYKNTDPLLQNPSLRKSGKKSPTLPFLVRLPQGYRLIKQRFWQKIELIGKY